jgi:putative flavoprotein involved in K+ transport
MMSGSSQNTTPSVLIIGAGPAGLALAFELKQRGITCVLLEKGPAVAHSWATMPARLKLVSPWKANRLAGMAPFDRPANAEISRADYCPMLQHYAQVNSLRVLTNSGVEDATHLPGEGFRVHTTAGVFVAPVLVNATGYFSNPFVPDYPGAQRSEIPRFHFATYRDADHLRAATRQRHGLILVVGKRLSAGQAMIELVDAGFKVALSHRGPIRFGAGPLGWWFFFRIHPALERLKLRLSGSAARGFEVRMPGGRARQLIESRRVATYPDIARFDQRRVTFNDGRMIEPDAVLYATGFRPALRHLAALRLTMDEQTGRPALRGFESADVPGLFFLGLDGLQNFRSRFIRGIREDAPTLAQEIVHHLLGRTQGSTLERQSMMEAHR